MVGAAIGGLLGLLWWGTGKWWPAAVAAAIVVAGDLVLTGMLHLDGLADSADGLLPHLDPERRLEVMRDHSVGAFGMAVGGIVILLRWAALESIRPSVLLLVGIWALSRGAMAVATRQVPYARANGGIASAFLAGPRARQSALLGGTVGFAAGVCCLTLWRLWPGLAVAGAEIVAGVCVLAFAKKRIGGFTGDVLGAVGVISETVALVVGAARW